MTAESGRDHGHGQWDVEEVLAFTRALEDLRARVDSVARSGEQRRRWRSRLVAISAGASTDLARARAQLGRLDADIDRHTRR